MTPVRILAATRDATLHILIVILAACVATACRGPRLDGGPMTPALARASGPALPVPTHVEESTWWVRTASLDANTQFHRTAAEGGGSGGGGAADLARKLQDPLADITALMTDNDILFRTGDGETTYQFQVQPVKSFELRSLRSTLIARAVVPVLGAAPEAQRPILDEPLPPGGSRTWGIGDITAQAFVAPKVSGKWKFGFGPQLSLATHTDAKLEGAGWGAGMVGVVTGPLTKDLGLAVITGHMWGFETGFSTSILQPALTYNFPCAPGWYAGYNNTIAYNWRASGDNA